MKKTTVLYMNKVDGAPQKARPVVTITTAKMRTIRVPVGQSEGWLNELYVKQVSGTSKNFTVELLDSAVPYYTPSDEDGEQAYNTAAAASLDLFRVIEQQTATAGNSVILRTAELGYPFMNADGTPTANEPYLYLTIIPNNSVDETTWEVAVTASKDIY